MDYEQYCANPWTLDGQVRANVVGIAPRISGPIAHMLVMDNGDLLQIGASASSAYTYAVIRMIYLSFYR
jgi:hypothetical protein